MRVSNDQIPRALFKYYSFNEYSLTNLNENSLFFSHRRNFNDPFDSKFHENSFKLNEKDYVALEKNALKFIEPEILKKRIDENPNYIKDTLKVIFNNSLKDEIAILNNLENQIGFCCLSSIENSLLMWSHYADSHKGFCLKFKTGNKPFTSEYLNKVTYPHKDSEIIIEGFADSMLNSNDNEKINRISSIATDILCEKHSDWKYEDEWRLLDARVNESATYNTESLEAVYFGLRSTPANRKLIYSILKAKNISPKLYLAVYGETARTLKMIPLNTKDPENSIEDQSSN